MNFEASGMLPAGFHDCTVQEFIATFVDDFPTSQRRKVIVDGLFDFAKEVFDVGVPCEFWVDGSFVTTKINPNDADLVLFLQAQNMNVLAPQIADFRKKYAGTLDMYFAYATSTENQQLFRPIDYQQIVNNEQIFEDIDMVDENKDNNVQTRSVSLEMIQDAFHNALGENVFLIDAIPTDETIRLFNNPYLFEAENELGQKYRVIATVVNAGNYVRMLHGMTNK